MKEIEVSNQARLFSIKQAVLIIGILAALKLSGGLVTGAHILLGLWSLLGVRQTIQALSLVTVIKYLNPVMYIFPDGVGIMGWSVILLGGMRLLLSMRINDIRSIIPIIGFSLIVAVLSTVQDNKAPAVSAMKLVMFTYMSCAIILGSTSLNKQEAQNLSTWFNSLVVAIVALSLPVFAFPEIAYARNGQGFQGILNHPQTFGPILAPTLCAVLASIFLSRPKNSLLLLFIALGLVALMIASQARTAMAAVALSMAFTAAVVFFKKKKFIQFRIGRFVTVSTVAFVALTLAIAGSSVLQEKLMGYMYKRNSTDIESALSSRSGGIESQWSNFLESPLVGYGFGVYRWGLGTGGAVEVMGLPISAPVEKGFLPTAILEETGILGGLSFVAVLIYLSRRVIARRNTQWTAIFFACLFVNVGEMVIFSVGGIGLLYWLMIGVAGRVPPDPGISNIDRQKNRSVPLRPGAIMDSAAAVVRSTQLNSGNHLKNGTGSQTGVSVL